MKLSEIINPTSLQTIWLNNTIQDYLIALGLFSTLWLTFNLFQRLIISRIDKLALNSKTDFDDFLISLIRSINVWFYFYLALYTASKLLNLPNFEKWLDAILIIWIVVESSSKIQLIVKHLANNYLNDDKNKVPVQILQKIIVGLIWAIGGLMILSSLGINVTSLVAGLGIGGIAVALALQNILGDLFSSFAIYFDKPFQIGDFITIDKKQGVVEKIGIKTTRIRALQGEEIVIANNDLTNARIHNYKKMESRRVDFTVGVSYDTPLEKLKKIPKLIEEIITKTDLAKFDRAHLSKLGDYSLNFEVIYYIDSPDYLAHMDAKHHIYMQLIEQLRKEKIELAFPTQTIFVKR